jgi:ABC-type oligopeptide transport system substrate-binding subunit
MMRVNKVLLVLVSLVSIFALAACSSNTGGTGVKKSSSDQSNHKMYMDSDSVSSMDMHIYSGSVKVPEGLKDAKNPT